MDHLDCRYLPHFVELDLVQILKNFLQAVFEKSNIFINAFLDLDGTAIRKLHHRTMVQNIPAQIVELLQDSSSDIKA